MVNIFSQMEARRRFEGHRHFFKWNHVFLNIYNCSAFQDNFSGHQVFKIMDIKKN